MLNYRCLKSNTQYSGAEAARLGTNPAQNPNLTTDARRSNTSERRQSSQIQNERLMEDWRRQWKSKRVQRKWLSKIHGVYEWKSMAKWRNQRQMQMRLSRIHIAVRLATCNILILITSVVTCLGTRWDQVGLGPLVALLGSWKLQVLSGHHLKKLGCRIPRSNTEGLGENIGSLFKRFHVFCTDVWLIERLTSWGNIDAVKLAQMPQHRWKTTGNDCENARTAVLSSLQFTSSLSLSLQPKNPEVGSIENQSCVCQKSLANVWPHQWLVPSVSQREACWTKTHPSSVLGESDSTLSSPAKKSLGDQKLSIATQTRQRTPTET